MKKCIVYSVVWLCVSQMAVADYILTSGSGDTGTNGGQSVIRYTETFKVVWERSSATGSAETAVCQVLISPLNGDVYTGNVTAPQLGKHLSYLDGSYIGRPIPQGGQTDGTGTYTPPAESVQDIKFGYDYNQDGVQDLWVLRRNVFEVYNGATLSRTGDDGTADILTSLNIPDSGGSSGVQDGTGGFGFTFGPDVTGDGMGELYVLAGINAATNSRLNVWNPVTMKQVASYNADGTRDNTQIILGADVNGDGSPDLWVADPRSHRIRAYDYKTGALVGNPVALVRADDGATAVTLRFPTDIDYGANGTFVVTTRFATSLDPQWAGAIDTVGGDLLQIQWDPVLGQGRVKLLFESSRRLDGVACIPPDPQRATSPYPTNKAVDVPSDVILGWTPGPYAQTHDLYLGTSLADVNAASRTDPRGVLISRGQGAVTYDTTGLLAFGQTYYWRIDEVNAPQDSTLFKGEVWSFTTETYSYPMTIPIVVTASSSSNALTGPENTVNGSGLDADDHHSIDTTTMWLTKKGQTPVWIQYEFDGPYSLDQIWVWNSNHMMELDYGYGVKDVTVEVSTDGATWTVLTGVPEFAQATAEATYGHNTTVDFDGVLARYVRLNILNNWGDMPQTCLSEVRFFYVPMKAFGPIPASGAAGVALDATLNWRPGRKAARHEVYISADPDAVINGTASVQTTTEHRMDLSSLGLDYGRTYYWKVHEVNEASNSASWEGDLWNFSTVEYTVLEDFESYDDACKRIYYTWIDQAGHGDSVDCGMAAAAGNGSGSTVGNATAPYAERNVVHTGGQSMPLTFDNTRAPYYSETQREWTTPQAWIGGGIDTLRLYLRGDATTEGGGNTPETFYVAVQDHAGRLKVVNHPDPAVIATGVWEEWNIPLSSLTSVGLDLSRITKMVIGVGDREAPKTGSTGKLYIDDIRLTRMGTP